jgi:hypothetical protein
VSSDPAKDFLVTKNERGRFSWNRIAVAGVRRIAGLRYEQNSERGVFMTGAHDLFEEPPRAEAPAPPTRNGNIWVGKAHQPSRSDVESAEERARATSRP